MTPEQRIAINKQNAQHSTGPKTPEGKSISAQNAVTHGLSSAKPPFENPHFLKFIDAFLEEYNPQTLTAHSMVLEIAHIAFKLEQFPQLEYEVELNSGLTLAEHFMQDKPTPLVKLWNLQLRFGGRFNTLDRKLKSLHNVHVHVDASPTPPKPPLQNKPIPEARSLKPEAFLQNKPTPPASSLQSPASPLQNKPIPEARSQKPEAFLQNEPTKSLLTPRAKLLAAVNSVPIPL